MPVIEPDAQLYENSKNQQKELAVVEKNSLISAFVGIRWNGVDCQFTDWSYIPSVNLWRDYLPVEIESRLPGLSKGDYVQQQFKTGELLADSNPGQKYTISTSQFHPPQKGLTAILPMPGRFYPKDFFTKIKGVYEGNKFPCRITAVSEKDISVDMNHPLAGKDIEMIFRVDSIKLAAAERGGRCNDIPSIACDLGPGLQDSLADQETDFSTDDPFSRLDTGSDSEFFKEAVLTPFWDSAALQQVADLYTKLIPQQARILDLMAGVHSPLLEAKVDLDSVTCAGLNMTEMEHNQCCNFRFNVDVNSTDSLPFQSAQFDTVLIHAAIEYVINPDQLFAEIYRILKPSGRVIISFSNRSIPEKTIRLWSGAHEFERPAIVLSYLRASGRFNNFNSYSCRGVLRPEDDTLADKLLLSDPVYAIWAEKI